jgi:hypothetical protein
VLLKIQLLWDVTSYRLVSSYRRFGGSQCRQCPGQAVEKRTLLHCLTIKMSAPLSYEKSVCSTRQGLTTTTCVFYYGADNIPPMDTILSQENFAHHLKICLTLSLLMSYIYIYIYIYGVPSKARNLTYIYGRDFYWGFCFLNRAFC